jgi:hypothetical protein
MAEWPFGPDSKPRLSSLAVGNAPFFGFLAGDRHPNQRVTFAASSVEETVLPGGGGNGVASLRHRRVVLIGFG